MHRLFAYFILTLLLTSCATTRPPEPEWSIAQPLFVAGTVQNVTGNEAVVAIIPPELKADSASMVSELARQVVAKSLFFAGIQTDIDGLPATVKEANNNSIKMISDKPLPFKEGSKVRLAIPKKNLAIVDFEVISGSRNEVGRMVQESLTTDLIDSGQFTVVERSKLQTVLNELKLNQSGMMQEPAEPMLGKMLNADLLLTGTLAETNGIWLVNLRMVNVRTGQALTAITFQSPLIKPSEQRDASSLQEDFENASYPTWNIGYGKSGDDYFKVSIDHTGGAENSASSLRLNFDFSHGAMDFFANANNFTKRDLSQYKGVEFYVKGTDEFHAFFTLLSSQPDDPSSIDNWVGTFEIDKEWHKIRIPFDKLIIGRSWVKQGAKRHGARPGDQVLRLHRIEAIRFGLKGKHNNSVKGAFWLDRIGFYRE